MNTEHNDPTDIFAGTTDDGSLAEQLLNDIEASTPAYVDEELFGLDDVATTTTAAIVTDKDTEIGLDRAALYAEQDENLSVGTTEEQTAIEHTAEQLAAAAATNKPATTRARRASSGTPGADATATTPSGQLKKKADVTGLIQLGYDQAEVDGILATIDAAPKKVAEKANNLIRYALGREHVAGPTKFTLNKLRSMPLGFTVVELVKMMEAKPGDDGLGYSSGTARSQSQQMSRLFGLFDMVSKDGKVLTLQGENHLTVAVLSRLNGDPFVATAPVLDTSADEEAPENEGDNDIVTVDADLAADEADLDAHLADLEVSNETEAEPEAPATVTVVPLTTKALSRKDRRAAAAAAKAAARETVKEPELMAA